VSQEFAASSPAEPGRSGAVGSLTALSAFRGAFYAAIDARADAVFELSDAAERGQFREKHVVELVPDSGFAPAAEPAPAGDPGSEPELGWQVFPVDTGVEDEQDALQALPVAEWDRAARARTMDRQQRLHSNPQRFVDLPRLRHACSTSEPEDSHRTTSPNTSEPEISSKDTDPAR
jgi:hypothetical protein